MTIFFFLEGNSCVGSTAHIQKLEEARGNQVIPSKYFGNVFTKDEFLAFTVAELQHHNVRECVIIGSSFGGHMSIHLVQHLRTHPEYHVKVLGLVLTGTPPITRPEDFPKAFITPAEVVEPGGRPVLSLLGTPTLFTEDESSRFIRLGFGLKDTLTCDEDRELFEANQQQLMTNFQMGRTRSEILPKLTTFGDEVSILRNFFVDCLPLLFIHGELDPVINLVYITSVVPQSSDLVQVIHNAPHYAHWSHPDTFMNMVHNHIGI